MTKAMTPAPTRPIGRFRVLDEAQVAGGLRNSTSSQVGSCFVPSVVDRGPNRVHHSAIVVRDMDRSLAFWRDGIGLETLMDRSFDGDWPTLFDAPGHELRSVFLGDPQQPASGLVELVSFVGLDQAAAAEAQPISAGFFLLSVYVDLETTMARLASIGVRPRPEIQVAGLSGPTRMTTVLDPDGVLVELIDVG
jgi:catechol 2,3-dioxygenase-like lactoylglutathione lyase family enzyme